MFLKRIIFDIVYSFIILTLIMILWGGYNSIMFPAPSYFWINIKLSLHESGFPYFNIFYLIFFIIPYELIIANLSKKLAGIKKKLLIFLSIHLIIVIFLGTLFINIFDDSILGNIRLLCLIVILTIFFVIPHYYLIDKKFEELKR